MCIIKIARRNIFEGREDGAGLKSLKSYFKGQNIREKLLLYFFTLILLPIATLGVLGNVIYSKSMEDQANSYMAQMIEQVTNNVEFYIHDMDNIMYYLSRDPNVIKLFRSEPTEDSEHLPENEVRHLLRTFTEAHPEISGILLVTTKDKYISNEMRRIARDPLTNEVWYKQAVATPDRVQLFSKPIGRNITTTGNDSADDVVAIAKAVTDPATGQILGVILIDLKLEAVKEVIEAVKSGKSGFLYIMDADGNIVYAPVNPIVYRVRNEWLSGQTNSVVKTIQKNNYQIIFKDSSYTKWKTSGVFSLNEALVEVTRIRQYSIMIGLFTLVLAVIAALFFTASVAKPIGKLRSLMKKAEEGDLSVRFNSKYNDEIGHLGNSFNNMIQEISNLIDMVYEEQKRKREAELKTLQAQIKPHFLYNTLDTIQWMAYEHNAKDIVHVVGALSNLFRIGLSKGKEMITVREELEHIKSYLTIQKARYEDKIHYEISCDERILDYPVLKLILQPLVENAIYHGLNTRRGGGNVAISAGVEENCLYFCVTDNGMGMIPEKLKEIEDLLDNSGESASAGFGIFNIQERIKLSFGLGYRLQFSSVYGQGTTVRVRHPIL